MTISKATFTIFPPSNHPNRSVLKPLSMTVVSAVEKSPPQGIEAINWLLLTTLEVNNFDEAVCCVRWYTYRWLIERYHYVPGSGCGIEKLQLETADRIKTSLWQLMPLSLGDCFG